MFIYVFATLVCLFLCLFVCAMFRVSLVFRSTSSVVSVCVYFCICLLGVPWFSLSRVLGLF